MEQYSSRICHFCGYGLEISRSIFDIIRGLGSKLCGWVVLSILLGHTQFQKEALSISKQITCRRSALNKLISLF